ncbi:hypothetical protein HanIR_Chr06g0267561 [Helianthus annuus]|nr:hypothetical protein HanIR_Chr06g0267561 [Helianthus annuus]
MICELYIHILAGKAETTEEVESPGGCGRWSGGGVIFCHRLLNE